MPVQPGTPLVLTCVSVAFPDRAESLSLSWSPLRELRTFSLPWTDERLIRLFAAGRARGRPDDACRDRSHSPAIASRDRVDMARIVGLAR